MAKKFTNILVAFSFFLFIHSISAQVTGVKYLLIYDTTTCLYNVNLVIASGSATTPSQRRIFSNQFTIVIPASDSLQTDTSLFYMPLIANQTYTGTKPCTWTITNSVFQPIAQPESNFYSLVGAFSPASFFNNLATGDTVKLFSVKVFNKLTGEAPHDCGTGVRFFINGVDPDSSAPGMNLGDFSNGYTMGGTAQLYESNLPTVYPPKPDLSYVLECGDNLVIDLNAHSSPCQDPLSFQWSGPGYNSTDEDVKIISPNPSNNGTYQVTVTDAIGCSSTLEIQAESKPDAGPDQSLCGTGSVSLSGSNPSSGTWIANVSNPSGATLGSTSGGNATVNFGVGINDEFEFIYRSALCSDTMKVAVSTGLTPTITGDNTVCFAGTTTLTANGGLTYQWDNGPSTATNIVGAGSYVVTATDASGCTGTASVTVIESSELIPTITGDNTVCFGETTTLTANGGLTYQWDNGPTTATNIVGAGSYVVTATDASGCTGTASVTVTESSELVPTITGDNTVCFGETTTLTANGGSTYQWDNGPSTATNIVGAGSYVVTATDASGCTGTASVTVTESSELVPTITGDNTVCFGEMTTLTANGGSTYQWDNGPSTATNIVGSGTYVVTATDASGCTGTASVTVTESGALMPTITGDNTICFGGTTTLTANGGLTYQWDNGPSTATNIVGAGSYVVTATDASGCTGTASVTVTESSELVPTITGDNTVCFGETTTLTANGGLTYQWDNGPTTATNIVGAGSYVVTATDASGCTGTASVTVTESSELVPTITGDNTICFGGTTTLTANGGATYVWSNGPITATNTVGAGSYVVTATDASGCTGTANVTVIESGALTPSISGIIPVYVLEEQPP